MPGFWPDFEQIFEQIFGQILGQIFDQIFGLVFDQGFDQGFLVPKIQCTVLLGRRNTVYIPTGTETYSFTAPPGPCMKKPKY